MKMIILKKSKTLERKEKLVSRMSQTKLYNFYSNVIIAKMLGKRAEQSES